MFKRSFLVGCILISFLVLTGAAHKFYVSITQIDINSDNRKLEISARIFTDDLEASILGLTGQKLRLGSDKVHPKADSLLIDWLFSGMNIKQEGHPLELIFIGKEVEADVTWIYLESREGISLNDALIIRNGLLQELFPDQKNLVNVRLGKQTVSQIHTKGKAEFIYQISEK